MKKDEEKRSSKIKELISALPAALENITRIWNNQDQTYKQRHFAIYKLSREDPMVRLLQLPVKHVFLATLAPTLYLEYTVSVFSYTVH